MCWDSSALRALRNDLIPGWGPGGGENSPPGGRAQPGAAGCHQGWGHTLQASNVSLGRGENPGESRGIS